MPNNTKGRVRKKIADLPQAEQDRINKEEIDKKEEQIKRYKEQLLTTKHKKQKQGISNKISAVQSKIKQLDKTPNSFREKNASSEQKRRRRKKQNTGQSNNNNPSTSTVTQTSNQILPIPEAEVLVTSTVYGNQETGLPNTNVVCNSINCHEYLCEKLHKQQRLLGQHHDDQNCNICNWCNYMSVLKSKMNAVLAME